MRSAQSTPLCERGVFKALSATLEIRRDVISNRLEPLALLCRKPTPLLLLLRHPRIEALIHNVGEGHELIVRERESYERHQIRQYTCWRAAHARRKQCFVCLDRKST